MLVEHPKFNGRRTESGRTPYTLHWRLIAIQSLFCVCFIDRLIIFIREHIFLFKSYNHRPYAQEESIYCSTGFITINNILFCCWCRVQWVGEPLSGELDCVYLGCLYFMTYTWHTVVVVLFHTRYSIGTEWLTESNCPLCAIKTHLIHIKVQSSHHHRQTDRLAVSVSIGYPFEGFHDK